MDIFYLIIIGLGVLMLLELTAVVIAVFMGNAKLGALKDEISKLEQSQQMAASMGNQRQSAKVERVPDGNNVPGQERGTIICRSCYSAIPSDSAVCPFCQMTIDRRG